MKAFTAYNFKVNYVNILQENYIHDVSGSKQFIVDYERLRSS